MRKIVLLFLIFVTSAVSFSQSFEPQIVPGPFWKPKLVADEHNNWCKPILIYENEKALWFVPEISMLAETGRDLSRLTMLYSYDKKTEETSGYILIIDRKTQQFALFGRAMQEKFFQRSLGGASATWLVIIEHYEQYVSKYKKEQHQLLEEDETRLGKMLKQKCPGITDSEIQNYRQHPNEPTDAYDCPLRAPLQK